ncbi:MAG: hypothetical protein ACP5PW_00110, partial [Candidatus Dormibacteria bacterium]
GTSAICPQPSYPPLSTPSGLSAAGYSVPQAAVAALRAGADLLLFNATPAQLGAVTSATISAIVAAVQSGSLPRSELVAAVSQVLAFKDLSRPQPATAGGRASGW